MRSPDEMQLNHLSSSSSYFLFFITHHLFSSTTISHAFPLEADQRRFRRPSSSALLVHGNYNPIPWQNPSTTRSYQVDPNNDHSYYQPQQTTNVNTIEPTTSANHHGDNSHARYTTDRLVIQDKDDDENDEENVEENRRNNDRSADTSSSSHLPKQSAQTGVYQITNEAQYNYFIQAYPDQLVVIKFYASYCQACRMLEPKFLAVKRDPQLQNMPIVWAEFAAPRHHGKDGSLFQTKLRVLTLPTIHFYDGNRGLVENFSCGPAKIPLLKQKLARFLNARVDPVTYRLMTISTTTTTTTAGGTVDPATTTPITTTTAAITTTTTTIPPLESSVTAAAAMGPPPALPMLAPPRASRQIIDNELITVEHLIYLRNLMFFNTLTDEEFVNMLNQAKLLTYNPGDLIIRQGMPGTTFYVIKRGSAEMGVRSRFDDPISTPPAYLGAIVNILGPMDYFGERALTTGEPYKASVRVLEKVRCFAFPAEIIPASSILSRKRRVTQELLDQLNQRYILPDDYEPPDYPVTPREECVLELLVRFKQIRQAAKCFEYMMRSEPRWGDEGEIARRAMLVRKLSETQRNEFKEVFRMVDVQQRGKISLLEMRKFMQVAGGPKSSDKELMELISRRSSSTASTKDSQSQQLQQPRSSSSASSSASLHYSHEPSAADNPLISSDEFLGLCAEAEFYNLFTETFQELDRGNTGYVRAGDLDEILGTVRDLISNDRTSIIDGEDKDLLVDYEQFSKMLLGAAL
jgi:calmodulin